MIINNKCLFLFEKKLLVSLSIIAMIFGQTTTPAQASSVTISSLNSNIVVGRILTSGIQGQAIPDQIHVLAGIGVGSHNPEDVIRYPAEYLENTLPRPSKVVIFDLNITLDDVGKTFTISSGAAFDEAVILLKNGIDDRIRLEFDGVTTGYDEIYGNDITGESNFLFNDNSGANGSDFADYDIDNISLTINKLILDIPGSDPAGNGNWIDTEFNATIKVNSVPIPAAVWFFSSGLLGLISFTRKNRVD